MKTELEDLKIYLLDANERVCGYWREAFDKVENVEVVCGYFADFMNKTKVECVVSPANSYGLMDGGYDLAITNWFGEELQKKVQRYILDNLYGEQPVGTSIILDTGKDGIKLIHTPTMRAPDKIRDPLVVYQCMRTCLMTAMNAGIKSIVIPAFGGRTGLVHPSAIADMMRRAYAQLISPPYVLNWTYASSQFFKY